MKNLLTIAATSLAIVVTACNAPPTAPTVSISPTSPKTDADLKANIVSPASDPNGDAVVYTFAWLKNGAPQADLTTDTVPAARTAKGEAWAVIVTPSDGKIAGPTAKAEATIGNTPPVATVVFEPVSPTKGGTLKAVASATDADSDTVAFTYAWAKDGNATTLITDTIAADQLARGQQWQVTVTPNDGNENGTPATASVTIGNAKPVVASVALTPENPTKATALSAAPAAPSDADGDTVTLEYTWAVNGTVVDGQTSPALATNFFNKGQVVTVTVTPNDTKDDGAPVSANATIGNSAPTAPVATITATPRDADDITCSIAIASADLDAADTVAYLFSWTKNGQPFSGATNQTTSSVVPNALTADGDVFACTVAATDGTVTTAGNTVTTTVRQPVNAAIPGILPAYNGSLRGYWSFDGDSQDRSGMDRHGVTHGVTFVGGKISQAASFSSGSYIDFLVPIVETPRNISVVAWVNPASTVNGSIFFFGPTSGCTPPSTYVAAQGGAMYAEVGCDGGHSGGVVPTNSWTHVAFVRNASGVESLYVNGTRVAGPTAPRGSLGVGNDLVGAYWVSGSRGGQFVGLIDELAVWNGVALSDSDVATIFNATK